ncbi:MAG: acetate--CoA ligase family protein, partial [Solirubrobacterales bacterium]
AISVLAGWDGIDALIVIFIRPLLTAPSDVATAIHEAVAALPRELPVQAVFMAADDHEALHQRAGVPTHRFPEDAARALGKVARYVRWRRRPAPGPAPLPAGIRRDEATAILAEALAAGREWLDPGRRQRLLECYGIATPAVRAAADPAAAGAAAEALGRAVALKAVGPEIVHKTELGAVRLGLSGAGEVETAAREIDAELWRRGLARESFEVQAMAGEGVELIVGIATDPVFGPVLACGAGGTAVELLGDVGLRVCPLDADDPAELLAGLAIRPLLDGYRGAPAADLPALEDLIARVGALAEAHHEIVELDLNPVLAGPDGALAVDARVRLAPAPPPRPWPRTWD